MENIEKSSSHKEKIARALAAGLAIAPMTEAPQPADAQTIIQQTYGDHQPNIHISQDGKVYQESHGRESPNIDRGSLNGRVHQESHGDSSPNISGAKGNVTITDK